MPPLFDRQAEAREWLAFARGNVVHANLGRGAPGAFVEYLCFDAQQAAEKALKAVLILHGVRPPRTHILGELLSLLGNSGVDVPVHAQRAEALAPSRSRRGIQAPRARALKMRIWQKRFPLLKPSSTGQQA